jgi:membrane-associated phospholipid phosphatase
MLTCPRRFPRLLWALGVVLLVGLGIQPAAAQNAAAFLAHAGKSARAEPAAPRASPAAPQTPSDPPGASPVEGPRAGSARRERDVPGHVLADQRAIWTSPFRLGKRDLPWLASSLAATAALIGSDKEFREHYRGSPGSLRASNRVSALGAPATLFGAAGAMYLVGRVTNDDRARETGLLVAEALVSQTIVVGALKAATNRERPDKANGQQDFFDGGKAFPSGHAAGIWAFAAVVGEQYRDRPLVRWGAYGIATAVSVSRATALKHSPSDVFVGGLIGYLIGRRVAARGTGAAGRPTLTFAPLVSAPARTVGVAGSIVF